MATDSFSQRHIDPLISRQLERHAQVVLLDREKLEDVAFIDHEPVDEIVEIQVSMKDLPWFGGEDPIMVRAFVANAVIYLSSQLGKHINDQLGYVSYESGILAVLAFSAYGYVVYSITTKPEAGQQG